MRDDDIWNVIHWKGTKTSILVSLDLANVQWSEHDSCIWTPISQQIPSLDKSRDYTVQPWQQRWRDVIVEERTPLNRCVLVIVTDTGANIYRHVQVHTDRYRRSQWITIWFTVDFMRRYANMLDSSIQIYHCKPVPPNTDPIPLSTIQYRPLLPQYHQADSSAVSIFVNIGWVGQKIPITILILKRGPCLG